MVDHFVDILESGALQVNQSSSKAFTSDVVLAIGEQIERLVEAADQGDGETFIALAERLRQTAARQEIAIVCDAASHAINAANEDPQIENLAEQSFELLTVCCELRASLSASAL